MKNMSDAGSYTFLDHVLSRGVRALSRLIGVKNLMRPFWNRWRASLIGEETIMRFLASIPSIDAWPEFALEFVEQEEAKCQVTAGVSLTERVHQLRRLSMLYHMSQWGNLRLSEEKRRCYRRSRDCYVQAEQLAHGSHYQRLGIPWQGQCLWGNLHLPAGEAPWPLLVIVHGMDDTKEEHLATELYAQEHGFAVFCVDAPGQGEALLLDNIRWSVHLCDFLSQVITTLTESYSCDPQRVGLLGISWGGMWAIKTAAQDQRVRAVLDVGGPIDARLFSRLPFFLKTKFCQVLGVQGPQDISNAGELFSLTHPVDLLEQVTCPLRIVHGGRDPLVPVSDKVWLRDRLRQQHPQQEVSLVVHPQGDHCCTAEAAALRQDLVDWFGRTLNRSGPTATPGSGLREKVAELV